MPRNGESVVERLATDGEDNLAKDRCRHTDCMCVIYRMELFRPVVLGRARWAYRLRLPHTQASDRGGG